MRALELGGCGFKESLLRLAVLRDNVQWHRNQFIQLSTAEFDSFIRGYHVYQVVWTPVVGEMLLLKQEPTNTMDVSAVAVCKENEIVGHVLFDITVSAKRL